MQQQGPVGAYDIRDDSKDDEVLPTDPADVAVDDPEDVTTIESDEDEVTLDDPADETFEGDVTAVPKEPPVTRSKSRGLLPLWSANLARLGDVEFALSCDEVNHITDPVGYEQVSGRPDEVQWRQAMKEEVASLLENDTWDLVKLPKDRKAIKNKWVFKTKRNNDGDIVRHKARLVAKRYTQRYGIDYDET